jgi:elongation factor Ts
MSEISAAVVRELRDKTGAGMMDCKKALAEAEGDLEKAVDWLRTKGLASASKKAGRTTNEGLVHTYVHPGGRVGVMMEINCESDFVARTPDFIELCKDLCMQVAAANPSCVRREEFPADMLERERTIFAAQAAESGKPEAVIEKMVSGRIEKMYKETVLLEQAFIKDPATTVEDRVKAAISKLGENISVRRFVRYQLGEAA